MACPNINLESWKLLVATRGEDIAYYLWDRYDGNVPDSESRASVVKAGLKSINTLQSDRAIQVFNTLQKNNVKGDAFWNKLQTDLQIPKDQLELLKQYNTTNREQLITNMLADYSYAVEINIAKGKATTQGPNDAMSLEENEFFKLSDLYVEQGLSQVEADKKAREEIKSKKEYNTQYYSNLTVPGGTNYTENEIATPAITPNIKGHAQFATENGIGWFRSDDQRENIGPKTNVLFEQMLGMEYNKNPTKTRRILEVQSDLFQKGRDKENLVSQELFTDDRYEVQQANIKGQLRSVVVDKQSNKDVADFKTIEEATKFIQEEINKRPKNQFLQLLNKNNNWVTFFVKSIIQDSAKKGYEKVLFPSGDTASKVEGHTTLEQFKKQKEDRIKELESILEDGNNRIYEKDGKWYYSNTILNKKFGESDKSFDSKENANQQKNEIFNNVNNEIKQLKQEIERVDKEGFGALRPIYNFYETTIANILKKQGYTPIQVVDEYGNTWNEVSLNQERDFQKVLLQTEDMRISTASSETVNKVKQILEKMGVSVKDLAAYARETGLDTKGVNGLADLTQKLIALAEGKEGIAITEEMVHVATAIMEQVNPKMVTEMIAKIDRFSIYKEVYNAYKDKYVLENGKPDIRKIKKEAVDKLIAEIIINQNEGKTDYPELRSEENQSLVRRWWNKILDFFRGMYKKSNIDIFEKAAAEITSEKGVGTVDQAKGQGVFLQTKTDIQKNISDKLDATENNIEKVTEEQSKVDPLLMDSEEATNFYKMKNAQGIWERIKNRVTDRVKEWYAQRFPGRTFTEAEKKFNELKRTIGVNGHNDLQEIHGRYYNADGTKKAKADDPPGKINMQSKEMYQKLENYYSEFVNTLPEGTLVFSEKIIYDEKSKEAGTIDFLAIEPSGKAHILDWKFMSFAKGADDVAWYKQGAYDLQLGRYKQILKDNYGIKEFGKIRAIPILLDFRPEDKNDPNSKMVLKGIAIGSVDTTKIEDLRLLPVSEASETTGDLILDNTIKDLNKALTQIGKKEVTNEEERLLKREELQLVQTAIRMARGKTDLAPLVEVVGAIKSNGDRILNDYNTIYKGKKASEVNVDNQALSEFSDEMRDYLQLSEVFKDLDKRLEDLIYKEEWRQGVTDEEILKNLDYRKDILNKLRNQTSSIYKTNVAIEAAQKDFVDVHIGQRNLISGLTSNEKVVKGFFSRFRGASELQSKAVNLLFKLTGAAKGKATADALQETKSLMDIRERLKKRGGDLRKLAQTIYQKDDKGGLINKLVHRYSKEFYEKLDSLEGTREAKLKWLRENIDIEKYKKDADKVLNDRIERIKNNHPDDAELQYKMIQDEQKRWNINREDFDGWDRDNYILARYPLDKWFSDDYKRIIADKDLNDLYNFVYDLNQKAADIGYISDRVAKTFLPFVRKSTAEGLAWDGTISAISTWADNLSRRLKLNPEDVGYGKYNEITGELENTIPKYYTYDFTFKDGTHDYSEVSEDLFANLILYTQHLNKYKYLSEVEGQLKVVKDIEDIKDHLKTNKAGDIIKGETERGNEANAKLFDNFMRTLLYEQKYVLSDEDAAFNIGKLTKGVRKAINKISKPVTGKDLFTIDDNSYSSMVKTIDAANRGFQLKTLGFDFISGAVNWFGGNIQSFVQSGNYFTGRELAFNQAKLLGQKLTGNEKEILAELVNTFMPLKEDPSYKLYKEAGMSRLTRQNLSDMLMVFMRKPEHLIEKTIFLSLLDNMMIENGKIISIPEFVKAKYKDRADSASKYKESQEKIKNEIAELKKTRSISVTKKMVDGKLEIPGLDLNNREELQRLTNLTRRISRNAVGGMSDGDINQMSMSIWTKSMMVFKGWIPKLTDTRFGEFRKVGDDFSVTINEDGMTEGEKYDIGRLRVLGYVLNSFIAPRVGKLVNMLYMTEKGMKAYDEMYEHYKEKYEKETGETLNMSKADFIDLMKNNMRKQVQEIAILASLFGASLALGSVAPGKDDDKASKNFHRYSQKVLDKFTSELSFFYNPANYEELLSGGIFPAVGILTDFQKFGTHFWMETTGIDLSDPTKPYDEVVKKAHPVKYLMKAAPVTKSLVTYFALFDADWAKEQDITVQKESRIKR